MHYLRLLRPPSLDARDRLKLVLTITTDLGDSFLCVAQPIPISVSVHYREPQHTSDQLAAQVKIDDGSLIWRSGLRVLKVELQLPASLTRKLKSASGSTRIRINASRKIVEPPNVADIPFDADGRILGLSVHLPLPGQEICYTATREFGMAATADGHCGLLVINEEIGESIDRHVWDAGVVTTGIISDICATGASKRWRETPLLQDILTSAFSERPLNVVELGCGVGILGIGLATTLSSRLPQHMEAGPTRGESNVAEERDVENGLADADAPAEAPCLGTILLTDLPDAEELTTGNIIVYQETHKAGSGPLELAFESLDWEYGKHGVFGPKASAIGWDLIIISDCTYNVDMLSALVDTLSALHASSVSLGKAGPKVMLATKPRHSSEKALFDLMLAKGWATLESAAQVLPLLGLDDERVEIYLFGKA